MMPNHYENHHICCHRLTSKVSRLSYAILITRLLLTITTLFLPVCAAAAIPDSLSSRPTTHYIVAFDQATGRYDPLYHSPYTLQRIAKALEDAHYDRSADYLSVVGYTMEMGQPSIQRFVRPYTSHSGQPILWKKGVDPDLRRSFPKWPIGQPVFNPQGAPYGSMQSLAKPYAVIKTANGRDSLSHADRTILLMVSDDVVNGTDNNYRQEWSNVSTAAGANLATFRSIWPGVNKTMQHFNEDFKFVQTTLKPGGPALYSISADGAYKITPYEVVPADKPSIHSVTDFPSPLPLQRVRGGFKVAADVASLTPRYAIESITLTDCRGHILLHSTDGKMDETLPSNLVAQGDTIVARVSLLLTDSLYNGARISPLNPRFRDGMISHQSVRIPDEAKVLGIFPLSDAFWWWFPNDIFTAVMLWDLIILLILIFVIGFVLYKCFVKINTYSPPNDKLKITKI